MKELQLGAIAGLKVSMLPSAQISALVLWAVASGAAYGMFQQTLPAAIVAGLGVAVLHYLGELWHQLGHHWAATRTGYPMTGVRFWLLLAQSLYPPDEPRLPGRIHIQRALGGPFFSFIAAIVLGVWVLVLQPVGGVVWGLCLFACLDNLLVFCLGAFLPLGFNDGSTILNAWRQRMPNG